MYYTTIQGCIACQWCSSLTPPFLHRITNAIAFTVAYVLMMVVVVVIYIFIYVCIYIYIYTNMYIGTIRLSYYSYCFLSCMYIVYFMVEWWERYKHIASPLLSFLLLLIVIYDGFGTYNETTIVDGILIMMMMMLYDVNLFVEYVFMYMPILFLKDKYCCGDWYIYIYIYI